MWQLSYQFKHDNKQNNIYVYILKLQLFSHTRQQNGLYPVIALPALSFLLRWNMACFQTISPTGNSAGERRSRHAAHRQISNCTRRAYSICHRCQKTHHGGWWLWVIASKCLLPCAVMHGGLVGSQSVLAAVCINNLLWWGIPRLMRRGALLYFLLLLWLIIWYLVWGRGCYLLLSC